MSAASIWALAGLTLIIADVAFGTFFMLFLGFGALITAGLAWSGVIHDMPTAQWLIFAGTSAAGLLLFRKRLVKAFGKEAGDTYQEHIGEVVVVSETIPPQENGRVKYRGAEWPARTVNGEALEEGKKAIIRQTNGIMLDVEAA